MKHIKQEAFAVLDNTKAIIEKGSLASLKYCMAIFPTREHAEQMTKNIKSWEIVPIIISYKIKL